MLDLVIPDRLMAGRLVLVQVIGVRIPVREPRETLQSHWGVSLWVDGFATRLAYGTIEALSIE